MAALSLFGLLFMHSRESYLEYNLLKLNPLETNDIPKDDELSWNDDNEIWLIGDSRIARWDSTFFNLLPAKVVNLGVEGHTTSQCLLYLINSLRSAQPDWVILEIGINDLKIIGLKRSLAPKVKTKCYDNFISIAQLCQDYNINLVIMNIFPAGDLKFLRRFAWNDAVDPAIVDINERLKEFCARDSIGYFDAYNILSENGKRVKKEYQEDFLHLNQEGYAVVSKNLFEYFRFMNGSN
jgi:lysophospholipase L1-like esterase